MYRGEDIWERVWKKNRITSDYSLKYLDFMKKIEQTLPAGSRVLEAGCGTGQTLSLFSVRHDTYGLDISPAAIELARKNCSFPVLGSIFQIPFADNSFDLVYNSGVIEHFRDPDNVASVMQMARVVKPSGRVIIIVPNTLCVWYKAGKWAAVFMKNFEFGYEEDYSPKRIAHTLQRAGLHIEKVFGLQVLPPLATNDRELLPLSWRKKIGSVEKVFPYKQYYAYTVGVIARKNS